MVRCLGAAPHRVGSSRYGRCLRNAGPKVGLTATSTKCDRLPPRGRPRRIVVPAAITKSGLAQRMWWCG
jgi:hypothetical protein